MGYRRLVQSLVAKAYTLAGTLAVEATLSHREAKAFDFATGNSRTSTPVVTVVKGFLKVAESKGPEQAVQADLVVQASNVEDPSAYDVIAIDGVSWNVAAEYRTNGYTTTFALRRAR